MGTKNNYYIKRIIKTKYIIVWQSTDANVIVNFIYWKIAAELQLKDQFVINFIFINIKNSSTFIELY